MSKTKVLILTKRDGWVGICPKYGNCINPKKWFDNYPDDNHPVIKCVFNNGNESELLSIDLNNFADETGVFLVYDSIKDINYLNRFKEQCKGSDLYVLIHYTGILTKFDFNDLDVRKFRVGSHVTNSYYMSIFDILTDKESNKMGRIIEKVFNS